MSTNRSETWVPLESNPEVMNIYLKSLGVDSVEVVDVYGFDEDLLAFIPQPVLALVLCFPINKNFEG